MKLFLKGIIVGFGGIAPGLSGSVLLIIFGLYQKTLNALGTVLKNPKEKLRFLIPLVGGMVLGVLMFSKLIDFCLAEYEMPTRFCFLGLILGTLPMVWREVRKEGFSFRYYIVIFAAGCLGLWTFTVNSDGFPQITDPTLPQCILLGIAVAATAIIPGVDPAVLLSTLGFYQVYVGALADLNLAVLGPMVIGLAVGAVIISRGMSFLFQRFYTLTFSVIFGVFLAMIPNMLTEECVLSRNWASAVSITLMILGFLVSWYLGDFQAHNDKMKTRLQRKRGL